MRVMVLVWCGPRSISPPGAAPAGVVELAKNSLAVKSWLLPDWLTKARVTDRPEVSRIGWGAKPKLHTWITRSAGWAAAGAIDISDKAARAARRDASMEAPPGSTSK